MRVRFVVAGLVLVGCFSDPGGSGSADAETSGASTGSTSTTAGPADATSAASEGAATSAGSESTGTTGDTGTGTGTDESASDGATSSPPDLGGSSCVLLDFDSEQLVCFADAAVFALGDEQVTVTNAAPSNGGPCVEDSGADDGETAPLVAHYLYVQISSNSPATLSFSAPVASVSFSIGPHHAVGTTSFTSICTTTAGACENPTAFADDTASMSLQVDLAGAQNLFVYLTDGVANLGIDELEVCFQR